MSKPHPLAVIPRHEDESLCSHRPGQPCPGTRDQLAVCGCGWHSAPGGPEVKAMHEQHARTAIGGRS